MGSNSSKLKQRIIYSNQIVKVEDTKFQFRIVHSVNKFMTLHFHEEIAKNANYLLSNIKENGGTLTIYYHQSTIYGISDDITHQSYISSKLSPTTFGWVLNN